MNQKKILGYLAIAGLLVWVYNNPSAAGHTLTSVYQSIIIFLETATAPAQPS